MRRITERQTEAGDRGRTAAEIAGSQRQGIIDGVEIDFRHPDLPAGEWEARPFWHVWAPPPTHAGILFPGEAAHGIDKIRAKRSMCRGLEPLYVHPGDKILIDYVEVKIDDRRFDHPHDSQQRWAYLRIERATGEIVKPGGPLSFFGSTQIRDGALRETFDHIIDRVCRSAGAIDLNDRNPQEEYPLTQFWELSLEDMALVAAKAAHEAYFELHAVLPKDDDPDPKLSRACLRSLVNSAALAGFLLAKAEARKAEKIGSATLRNREKGTAKVTRMDWREKAESLWAANPTWTKNRVAREIAAGTDDDPRSIMRNIDKLIPVTSPSYKER